MIACSVLPSMAVLIMVLVLGGEAFIALGISLLSIIGLGALYLRFEKEIVIFERDAVILVPAFPFVRRLEVPRGAIHAIGKREEERDKTFKGMESFLVLEIDPEQVPEWSRLRTVFETGETTILLRGGLLAMEIDEITSYAENYLGV